MGDIFDATVSRFIVISITQHMFGMMDIRQIWNMINVSCGLWSIKARGMCSWILVRTSGFSQLVLLKCSADRKNIPGLSRWNRMQAIFVAFKKPWNVTQITGTSGSQ